MFFYFLSSVYQMFGKYLKMGHADFFHTIYNLLFAVFLLLCALSTTPFKHSLK
jgi:hypothetical protein